MGTRVEDLTPEQITVLKMISEDGIDASLSNEQYLIRDQLDDMELIYGSGDEYDFDIFISKEAKLLLNQLDPQWWINQREQRQRKIAQTKEQLILEPMESKDAIDRLTSRYEQVLASERERH